MIRTRAFSYRLSAFLSRFINILKIEKVIIERRDAYEAFGTFRTYRYS